MSRDFNGYALQDELAARLGDTSTTFKARVLKWINDIQLDICSRHDWYFLRQKGKKVLTASQEYQPLELARPTAPTVAIAAGGSLTDTSVYNVVVTFVEGISGVESIAGVASADVTATAVNKTITVTDIPVSGDPLVTARKLYLITDDSEPLFYSTISDNTTTTASITSEPTSTIEAPDYSYITKLDGNAFIEGSRQLLFKSPDELRLLFPGTWGDGTPNYWAVLGDDSYGRKQVILYPRPSSASTLSYYYYKTPERVYAETTSRIAIPPFLREVLKNGVIWRGLDYSDRDGSVGQFNLYESSLKMAISRMGTPVKVATRVRDVIGDANGFQY